MNDKQIRRLFAEIDEIKGRILYLEKERIATIRETKPKQADFYPRNSYVHVKDAESYLFPRNQFPWSSFERDLVAEKLDTLIKEISLKIGRSPAQVGGRMINYLKKDF